MKYPLFYFLFFMFLSIAYGQDSIRIAKTEALYSELLQISPPNPDVERINELVDSIFYYYEPVEVKDMDFFTTVYEYINNIPPHIVSWEKTLEVQKKYLHHYKIQLPDDALNSADAYGNMAFSLTMLGRYKESIEDASLPNLELLERYYASDTLGPENKEFVELGLLVTTSYLSMNYRELGDANKEMKYAKVNEKYLSTIKVAPQYEFIKRDCYRRLLVSYFARGYYKECKIILGLWKAEISLNDPLSKMMYYHNLSTYYERINDNETLEEVYEKAKVLFLETPDPKPEAFANYYGNVISQYSYLFMDDDNGNPDKVIKLRKEDIDLLDGQQSYVFSNPSHSYLMIAKAFYKKKELDSVRFYLEKASASIANLPNLATHSEIHAAKGSLLESLDEFHLSRIEMDSSLLKMKYPPISRINDMEVDAVDGMKSVESIDNILSLAQTYAFLYEKTKSPSDLLSSNSLYLLASKILNSIKLSTLLSGRELNYFAKINNGILETYRHATTNNVKTRSIFEVLNYIELNQAIELNYKYGLNTLSNKNEEGQKALQRLKELEYEIVVLENKLVAADNDTIQSTDVLHATELLFKNKTTLRELKESLVTIPGMSKLLTPSNIDLERIQHKIGSHDIIARYFYSDENLFLFKISEDKITFDKVESKENINPLIETYYNALRQGKQFPLNDLSDVLIPTLKSTALDMKRLIVIGNLQLYNIPFESLKLDNELLLNKTTISYYPSLRLLEYDAVENKDLKVLAGFAPTYSTSIASATRSIDNVDFDFGNLKGAKEEINNITSFFQGDSYVDNEATKANFIEQSKNYKILHLAGHSYVTSKNSYQSVLLFTKDSISSSLGLDEIYGLNLSTSLVVLSACDTGNGPIDNSEGVMSLARAFHYAGSDATLTSLWKVPDKETAIIMTFFYKYLEEGLSKDKSLQKAKLAYLSSVTEVQFKHPFYWAGFVLSGDVTPVAIAFSFWWIVLGIGIVLLFLFIIKQSKKFANR